MPCLLHGIHLGDLFFERAPRQLHAKHARFKRPVLLLQPRRAAVFPLVMALDAVMRLIQRARQIRARVGKLKPFAMPPVIILKTATARSPARRCLLPTGTRCCMSSLCGVLNKTPPCFALALRRQASPTRHTDAASLNCSRMRRSRLSSHRATCFAKAHLRQRLQQERFQFRATAKPSIALACSGDTPVIALRCTKRRFTEKSGASS